MKIGESIRELIVENIDGNLWDNVVKRTSDLGVRKSRVVVNNIPSTGVYTLHAGLNNWYNENR